MTVAFHADIICIRMISEALKSHAGGAELPVPGLNPEALGFAADGA